MAHLTEDWDLIRLPRRTEDSGIAKSAKRGDEDPRGAQAAFLRNDLPG